MDMAAAAKASWGSLEPLSPAVGIRYRPSKIYLANLLAISRNCVKCARMGFRFRLDFAFAPAWFGIRPNGWVRMGLGAVLGRRGLLLDHAARSVQPSVLFAA